MLDLLSLSFRKTEHIGYMEAKEASELVEQARMDLRAALRARRVSRARAVVAWKAYKKAQKHHERIYAIALRNILAVNDNRR